MKSIIKKIKIENEVSNTINYHLFLPDNYKDTGKKWPLIIYLHTWKGEEQIKNEGIPRYYSIADKECPFLCLAPKCGEGNIWINEINSIIELLSFVIDKYNVDKDKIFVTGVGRFACIGVFELTAHSPSLFKAIAAINGHTEIQLLERINSIPIYAINNETYPFINVKEKEVYFNNINRFSNFSLINPNVAKENDKF